MKRARIRPLALALGAAALALACDAPPVDEPTPVNEVGGYPTPEAASDALVAALRTGDDGCLVAVLGPDACVCLESGDEPADADGCEEFLAAYDRRHACIDDPDGIDGLKILVVGEDEWPLPIPLVRNGDGWCFDTERGLDEIEARRVGANERCAIEVCRAIVDAQDDYAAADPGEEGKGVYAGRFLSTPGRRDGLCWTTKEGEAECPLGQEVAQAAEDGGGADPCHGYRFRMLTRQGEHASGGARDYVEDGRLTGGFAVVAWPASYGESGVMTLIVNQCGVVYERDLGEDTGQLAAAIDAFDPGPEWQIVEDGSDDAVVR